MPLRLYADECVDARVVAGLRRRRIDVMSAADAGLLGASDEAHFERATELGRVMVTNDHDFLGMVHERIEARQSHPGLLFLLPGTSVGAAIRGLALAVEVLEPADMRTWIEWVP